GFGTQECDITHSMANRLKVDLERQGHQVLITNGSLSNRTTVANNWGADIFISLHCNAFNSKAYGIETYCYKLAYRELADAIHGELLKNTNLYRNNRGVKEGNFQVIRETNMDACLIELAFIDNREDNLLLRTYQDEYSVAVTKGVQSYFGLDYVEAKSINIYEMNVNGEYYGQTTYEDIAVAVEKEMAAGVKRIELIRK
ncbi:MAG: N-acetylmuramoyl-L-alanine amidase, partial [Clostridium sp.]